MQEDLPPEIPGKDDKDVPKEVPVSPKDAEDDESGEEWRVDPGQSVLPAIISQTVSSPVAAVSNAASVVQESTIQAAQTIKENSNHTYTLINEGEWRGRSPAEWVAMNLIVPILPRPHRKTYTFTFGGLQGTLTRLYLACQPLYAPFIQRMVALMTWEDPRRSFFYCVLFWILWFFDLLLPALFARLTYSLLRRRLLPYPTAQELVERRSATARAEIMGSEIRAYLDSGVTGGVGMKDAWKMFRLATKNKKQKAKDAMGSKDAKSDSTPDDVDYAREDEDSKRAALAAMEEIADFHERFANLCHWRDPDASMRYTIILGIMVIVSLFTPAKYVVKGIYAGGGIGFWFIPNIWAALPLEHRSRIPAPLGDVPTDAEYAMRIIGERVDRGEAVLPSDLRKKKDKKRIGTLNGDATRSANSLSPSTFTSANKSSTTIGSQDEANVADPGTGKNPMGKLKAKVKNVVFADQKKRSETHDENGEPLPEETFPAKYHASMGMLTLTSSSLAFYAMMSSNAKVVIPLSDIRGVKKAGRMGGLRIRYVVRDGSTTTPGSPRRSMDTNVSNADGSIAQRIQDEDAQVGVAINGEPLEREEKFGWVSGRDELFARLVGWGNRRWVKM